MMQVIRVSVIKLFFFVQQTVLDLLFYIIMRKVRFEKLKPVSIWGKNNNSRIIFN